MGNTKRSQHPPPSGQHLPLWTTPPSPRDQVTTPPSLPPGQHLPPSPGTRSQHLPPPPPPGPGFNTSFPLWDQVTTPPPPPPGTRSQHLPPLWTTPPSPPMAMRRRAVRILLEYILVSTLRVVIYTKSITFALLSAICLSAFSGQYPLHQTMSASLKSPLVNHCDVQK